MMSFQEKNHISQGIIIHCIRRDLEKLVSEWIVLREIKFMFQIGTREKKKGKDDRHNMTRTW